MARERTRSTYLSSRVLASTVGIAASTAVRFGRIAGTELTSVARRSAGLFISLPPEAVEKSESPDVDLEDAILPSTPDAVTTIPSESLTRGCRRVRTLKPEELAAILPSSRSQLDRVKSMMLPKTEFILPSVILDSFQRNPQMDILYVAMIVNSIHTMKIPETEDGIYVITPFSSFQAFREKIGFKARSSFSNPELAAELSEKGADKICTVICISRLEKSMREQVLTWVMTEFSTKPEYKMQTYDQALAV